MALFADWCQYEHDRLHPTQLIANIETQTKDKPEKTRQQLFETILIERVALMRKPEDMAVTYMAFAYRRMTPDMFSFITGISTEESKKILLENLKPLSFIKYKEGDIVLLHDEMREMVINQWWKQQDATESIRKSLARKLAEYYDNKLLSRKLPVTDKAVLSAEQLSYQLYVNLEKGFDFFISQFDKHLHEYRIYFCDLLIQEILAKPFYEKLSPDKQWEIDIRRIRWCNEQYRSEDALKVIEKTESDSKKQEVMENDKKLLAAFKHEKGIAHFWLNRFDAAVRDFSEAEREFRRLGQRYDLAEKLNWVGYAHYRSGKLLKSERILKNSLKEYLKLKNKEDVSSSKVSIGIANVYSNLNAVLRRQGRFYGAANYGEIAVFIAEQMKNDRELARFLNALAETYKFANKAFEASKSYKRALEILKMTQDPLLKARVVIGKAFFSSGYSDYIYMIEYYQRGTPRKEAIRIFKEVYPDVESQFEKAIKTFSEAETLLKDIIKQPTAELADLYFNQAEYCIVNDKWEEAVAYFRQSEKIAREVSYEYREVDAIVGQIIVYYFDGKDEENRKKIEGCENLVKHRKNVYHNLSGKMEVMIGNFFYEQYLKGKNDENLKEAVKRYVTACDHMYAYSHVTWDRFYASFRILVKRMGDIPLHDLMRSEETIRYLGDIWNYDENEREVCQRYNEKFDEIIDFALKRIEIEKDKTKLESYIKEMEKRARNGLDFGKEELRFAPMYAEILAHLQRDFGTPRDQTEACFFWPILMM